MWLYAILAVVAALLVGLSVAVAFAERHPSLLMWQWGKFINYRPGIKNDHERVTRWKQEGLLPPTAIFGGWHDEPDQVPYDDFKYWIRLRPNLGLNLPIVGYYSRSRGRQKLIRPW